MESQFNVGKIVAYLKPFSRQLPELYQWEISSKAIRSLLDLGIWSDEEIATITALENQGCYEKGIAIKAIISQKFKAIYPKQKATFNQLSLWIIKDWGGIKGSKKAPKIDDYHSPDKLPFKRIASSSKVAAFMHPEQCIIYDSRVAYSLNWILLAEKANDTFFPMPEGRNTKMNAFDVDVLIRQKNIERYQADDIETLSNRRYIHNKDKQLYIDDDKAYATLNQLIKSVHQGLWKNDKEKTDKLYYTEMLLFSIADREIFVDITQRLSLNITP